MTEAQLNVKEIPQEVITEATAAFQNGFALLKPYLQALTTEDRRKLFKMSDGSEPFVSKTVEYVQASPQFVPAYMDADSLKAGFATYGQLVPFSHLFADFGSLSGDTRIIAGAQALRESRKYYDSVQTATKNRVPGAKAIFDELKKRFAHKKRKKPTDEAAA